MSTVALVFFGDSTDPDAWSGTPAGLAGGLEDAGMRVARVSAEPPPALDRRLRPCLARLRGSAAAANYTRSIAASRTAAAARRLRRAGRVDAVIQLGTHYRLHPRCPSAVYFDMTVRQGLECQSPFLARLPKRELSAWIRRQGRVFRGADACCAFTSWAADSVVRDYDVDPQKVHVVGLGRNVAANLSVRNWSEPRCFARASRRGTPSFA